MKKTIVGVAFLSIVWLSSCGGSASPDNGSKNSASGAGAPAQTAAMVQTPAAETPAEPAASEENVVHLTKAMFLEKVYDFEKNPKQWTYKGDKPCIIDFYADWCRPCKMVAPIMAELGEKYKGQVIIYKINTDQEPELSQFFGIRSIPTVFFCPATGDPQMAQGALPKETYEKAITELLLKKK